MGGGAIHVAREINELDRLIDDRAVGYLKEYALVKVSRVQGYERMRLVRRIPAQVPLHARMGDIQQVHSAGQIGRELRRVAAVHKRHPPAELTLGPDVDVPLLRRLAPARTRDRR